MNESMIANLMNKKKQVESAKRELAESEGALKELTLNLSKEFDVDNIESAEKLFEYQQRTTNVMNINIEKQCDELDAKFPCY